MNKDHENPVAAVAAKNGAWREGEHVQFLRAHLRNRPAGGAGSARNGHLVDEQLSEDPGCRVAVEPQLSLIHPQPPVGPNLSVFTRSAGLPSSTSVVATASTKGVGPQTMHSGCCSAAKPLSASMARSIRLEPPRQPGGWLRVNV